MRLDCKKPFDDFRVEVLRWRRPGRVVVPDTNVFLHHPSCFHETDWAQLVGTADAVRIVMPLVIVDELDRKKFDGKDAVRTRARTTLRAIDDLVSDPRETTSVSLGSGKAFLFEMLLDPIGHVRLPNADDEIIDRVAAVSQLLDRPPLIVTYDTGAALRASVAGLPRLKLSHHSSA